MDWFKSLITERFNIFFLRFIVLFFVVVLHANKRESASLQECRQKDLVNAIRQRDHKSIIYSLNEGAQSGKPDMDGIIPVVEVKGEITRSYLTIPNSYWTIQPSADAQRDLKRATKRGDLPGMNSALERGAVIDFRYKHKNTALILAIGAFRRSNEVIRLLLDRQAWINMQGWDGNTALNAVLKQAWLMQEGDPSDIVKILLDHGADQHIPNSQEETPLQLAGFANFEQSARWLLEDLANRYPAIGCAIKQCSQGH